MLQQLMALFREADGRTLSRDAVRQRLDVTPEVLDQMLLTLVQRGRLIETESGCAGCSACPLQQFCATVPPLVLRGYALAEAALPSPP